VSEIRIEVMIPINQWKNDNGSHGHWAVHNRLMRALNDRGAAIAHNHRMEHDGISFQHCMLDVYVCYAARGRSLADPSNADNIGKPIIDGFTRAGLWPDDRWKYVEGPFYRLGERVMPPGMHMLEFVITGEASYGPVEPIRPRKKR
jgi:crossover junction endodeoxyribonuclease RusA